MKIQGLAIIFIIIILPITIIIGEYAATQIKLLRTEQLYDSRLVTATYDSLKIFQINTFNDAASDIADSKISSIEAAVKAFYNSMEVSFGLEGYSKEDLQSYIPAIVYTMYDGYYIYSPYTNVAQITDVEDSDTSNELDEDYTQQELTIDLNSGDIEYGFKPYVYYSCRYVYGDIDVVINYSLDNYITVQGTIGDKGVYESGYLVTIASSKTSEGVYFDENTKKWYYSGIEITEEQYLTDTLVESDGSTREYTYVKLNGTKYYLNNKDDDGDGVTDEYIFYLMGGNRIQQVTKSANEELYNKYVNQIKSNSSAKSYYRDAYKFTIWVNTNLSSLKPEHAQVEDSQQLKKTSTGAIFNNEQIEYLGSNFDLHRKEVIRYSIESNLSVAIANFNEYAGSSNNFQMPKLTESEWELLENEISIISFLQGLNMGGKIYNGYTVVTNAKTGEVVKEESIYIKTSDGYYHKINDKHLLEDDIAVVSGILNLDFEIRKDGATGISYIQKKGLGCYTSIVGQENVNNRYSSIYKYLESLDNDDGEVKNVKKLYYTALARERWETYKTENPSSIPSVIEQMWPMNDYDIVTDGLIRFYDAANVDGDGNSGNSSTTVWQDLSGNYNATINGATANTSGFVTFDGVDDWANAGKIPRGLTEITLEVTVKIDNIPTGIDKYIIGNSESGGVAIGFDKDGNLFFKVTVNGSSKYVWAPEKLETGKVYNISGTYDGDYLRLYIDGECVRTTQAAGTMTDPSENTVLVLGTNPLGNEAEYGNLNMKLYSARVYDRVLTSEEIEKNHVEMKKTSSSNSSGSSPDDVIIPDYVTAADITADDYGAYITNYTPTNGVNDEGIKWKIFHSDGSNIYLIADDYVPLLDSDNENNRYVPYGKSVAAYEVGSTPKAVNLKTYTDYVGWSDISSSSIASKWLSQYVASAYTSTNANMRGTAYLLDTNIWSGFKDSSGYAEYAIGGPTIELFAASYNATHEKDIETEVTSQKGYRLKWSTDSSYTDSIGGISTSETLYVISDQTNAFGMWIASPGNLSNGFLTCVNYGGAVSSYGSVSNTYNGMRPIICLNSGVKLEKQEDGISYKIVN